MKYGLSTLLIFIFIASTWSREEIAVGDVFSVVELSFQGPQQSAKDSPARDIDFWVRFRHESGSPTYTVHGFWNGNGKGASEGNHFQVRFCPTEPGKWDLIEVYSNAKELRYQREGDFITASESDHPGFWLVDPDSAGRRWYKRSNGSHQYIVGNTHYSFLSGYKKDGVPSGNDIAEDIRGNAKYFKKLRFGLSGDYYVHPEVKPYLDNEGKPTDSGDFSHRPNPQWFHDRVDLAVKTAYEHDLIADMILAGPDLEISRSTLRASENGGDPTPFLKYMAARYGSFPNVWFCLCNEYEIRKPIYSEEEIVRFGQIIREYLPYPSPLSVHATPNTLWADEFVKMAPWYDHAIIQIKLRNIAPSADVIQRVWSNQDDRPLYCPIVNDELSYQGEGDKHSEEDTIESHLGAFLGGGYGTTSEKPGNKTGQYFWGKFDPNEHTAAESLKWLREVIDRNISFWNMSPDSKIFSNLDEGFRGMAWPDHEYVLGTNKQKQGILAKLPKGKWIITQYDVISREGKVLSDQAEGEFKFDSPGSRAVLYHIQRTSR